MAENKDATPRPPLKDRIIYVGSSELSPQDRKESAINLRLDSTFSWAQVIGAANDMIAPNRELDFIELKKRFEDLKSQISRPDYADSLLKQLRLEDQRQKRAIKAFRKLAGLGPTKDPIFLWPTQESDLVAGTIFEKISGRKPEFRVALPDTPLAVSIVVNQKDLLHLNGNEEKGGGFFNHQKKLKNKKIARELGMESIPFIAVSDSFSLYHELGHALIAVEQKAIEQTLKKGPTMPHKYWLTEWSDQTLSNDRQQWSRWMKKWLRHTDPLKYKQMKEDGTLDSESIWQYWLNTKSTQKRKWLQSYIQEHAVPLALRTGKEELIVDYKKNRNLNYIYALLDQESLYNIVNSWMYGVVGRKHRLRGKVLSTYGHIYAESRKRYYATLSGWHSKAESLLDAYKVLGLDQRVKYFGEIITQIPCDISSSEKIISRESLVNPANEIVSVPSSITKAFEVFESELANAQTFQDMQSQIREMNHVLGLLNGGPIVTNLENMEDFYRRMAVYAKIPGFADDLQRLMRRGRDLERKVRKDISKHEMQSLIPIFRKYEKLLQEWEMEAAIFMEGPFLPKKENI